MREHKSSQVLIAQVVPNMVIVTSGGQDRDPAWSPDGSRIVYPGNRINGIGIDSSGPVYGHDFGPAWSPDGNKIVFWSDRNGFAAAISRAFEYNNSLLIRKVRG